MRLPVTFSLSLLACLASAAKTIHISVGKSGNTFEPSSITADVGDSLSFTFYPQKHAVVSSNFDRPCKNQLGNDGFSSDFVPVAAGKSPQSYVFKVTSTDPLFFYCPQSRHCQSGMVGVVNPSDSQTLEQYKQAAANVPVAQDPPPIYGLTVVGGDDSPTTTTTSTKRHTATTTSDVATTTSASATTSTSGDSGTTGSAPNQTVPTTQSSSTSATTSSSSRPNSGAMSVRTGGKSAVFTALGVVALSAALTTACGLL